MSTYQRKETHASIRRNRHPDCNLLAIDQEQQVTQVTTTRSITILTGGYIFLTTFTRPYMSTYPTRKEPSCLRTHGPDLLYTLLLKSQPLC